MLTGVTVADVEAGLSVTRHGQTLAEVFAVALCSKEGRTRRKTLIVAVEGGEDAEKSKVKGEMEEMFASVAAAACGEGTMGS